MTPSQLIQCMRDYGTLSAKQFHAKYPEFVERERKLATLRNCHTWEIGASVFIEIAKEMGE